MLKLFEDTEKTIEQQNKQCFFEARLNYFASEIMQSLEIEDAEEIANSYYRAFQACSVLHISFNRNFKRVYRYDGTNMIADWKVSALAYYLIIINCNPCNEQVAKAQLYFAFNNSKH